MPLNIEIKARCANPAFIRNYLLDYQAEFIGTDSQCDTYFKVPNGRLKLREGNIENALIFYERSNQPGPKKSSVILYQSSDPSQLKLILEKIWGIKQVVAKKREIYFIGNVKFHIDDVQELGAFVEIEAIDKDGSMGEEFLREQCDFYMCEFQIHEKDLLAESYSDILLSKNNSSQLPC